MMAKEQGVSEHQVREDMKVAILEGYKNRDTHELWGEMFGETIPPPEEFIITMTAAVRKSRAS